MIKTEIIEKKQENIDLIIERLKENKLVIIPTNSVYGLIGNGLSKKLVDRIFAMKGRERNKPLSCFVAKNIAVKYGHIDTQIQKLIDLWPAPVSIIVKKKIDMVPDYITSNMDSVLLVCLDEFTERMAMKVNFPIIATSANISGNESNTSFNQVYNDFNGIVDVIVKGTCSETGQSSTIINFTYDPPRIQRIGLFDVEKVKNYIPKVEVKLF